MERNQDGVIHRDLNGKRILTHIIVVEIELRLPSMLHGKKGFDRILYAFKNVLNKPVKWLFCDLGLTGKAPLPIVKDLLTVP